jgi:hypothetical protein
LGEFGAGGKTAPITFEAQSSEAVTIEAFDLGEEYLLGPIFLHQSGHRTLQLTSGVPSCSLGSRPCPVEVGAAQLFFQQTFQLTQ